MGFIRKFDVSKIDKLSDDCSVIEGLTNKELYDKLKVDVLNGEVFPAIRKEELHFYYEGGLLCKITGNSFFRDDKYEKYNKDTEELKDSYDIAKQQCKNRYGSGERQLLDKLNRHTFDKNRETKVVVLDIEVRLNGQIGGSRKCDLVLLNTKENEIMFVEGKVFSDNRVNVAEGRMPGVIEQVEKYTEAIKEQPQEIVEQYEEHIKIINNLFGTKYEHKLKLIPQAKLLVYNTPTELKIRRNGKRSKEKITAALGENNVVWYEVGEDPSIDAIWDALCK